MEETLGKIKHKFNRFLRILGPGLITGAADDDPSGIATYSQTGAQFGFGQLWLTLFIFPLMTAVQETSARIGAVTGKGIVTVCKQKYGKRLVYFVVFLILIANTINLGIDIGAMAEAARLIIPLPFEFLTIFFVAIILIMELSFSYRAYARTLKWLAIALFSYVLTIIIINPPWDKVLLSTITPNIELSFPFLFLIIAVLGTTISPYMFFWEANEEVEEEKEKHLATVDGQPRISWNFIKSMRIDNFIGMLISEIGAWAIIITTATTLNTQGITNIETAADAAKALEPLVNTFPNSGFLAKLIFSVGIVGLGLLAVPVLSGSASYAVAETFNWKAGLSLKIKRARGFYAVITIATIIGLLINFVGIHPMKALVVAAVINGVLAIPLLFIIYKIGSDEKIMGEYKSKRLSRTLVLITLLVMTLSAIAMFATFFI
jgi:NRAMP (natural resistance-associated macrophage protein)-like metal ion transporter